MILKDLQEIMKVFRSTMFAVVIRDLQDCHDLCDEARRRIADGTQDSENIKPSKAELKRILTDLSELEKLCEDIGLKTADQLIGLMHIHVEAPQHDAEYSSLTAELRNAIDAVMIEFWKRKFAQIPEEFSGFVNNEAMFGPDVNKAFPDAGDDLKEAGNCIAIDSGTAAVFHLMRAVEWSLRGLCADLGIVRVRRSYKHKQKYTAIAWAQWERMLEEVHKRIDRKVDKLGPGKRKQELQEFYYPLMHDYKSFKDAFRNHVTHGLATYSQKAAADICDHVGRFMKTLAPKLAKAKP
jgi:hypothetical protein